MNYLISYNLFGFLLILNNLSGKDLYFRSVRRGTFEEMTEFCHQYKARIANPDYTNQDEFLEAQGTKSVYLGLRIVNDHLVGDKINHSTFPMDPWGINFSKFDKCVLLNEEGTTQRVNCEFSLPVVCVIDDEFLSNVHIVEKGKKYLIYMKSKNKTAT